MGLFGSMPAVVVDIETTGLDARDSEIVEISAWLVPASGSPRRVLNTMVKPRNPVRCTDIHGLSDADVGSAPTFGQLLPVIETVFANRAVVAHNARFDLGFLEAEFARIGRVWLKPRSLCTMALARLLGMPRMSLNEACRRLGVSAPAIAHSADNDARATANVYAALERRGREMGVNSLDDLEVRARQSKAPAWVVENARTAPWRTAKKLVGRASIPLKPRNATAKQSSVRPIQRYHSEVLKAITDLLVDGVEETHLAEVFRELKLRPEAAREVHTGILQATKRRYAEDDFIDPREAENLTRLEKALETIERRVLNP